MGPGCGRPTLMVSGLVAVAGAFRVVLAGGAAAVPAALLADTARSAAIAQPTNRAVFTVVQQHERRRRTTMFSQTTKVQKLVRNGISECVGTKHAVEIAQGW